MEQKWHITVREKQRKEADRALLLQAMVAFIKEWSREDGERDEAASKHTEEEQ